MKPLKITDNFVNFDIAKKINGHETPKIIPTKGSITQKNFKLLLFHSGKNFFGTGKIEMNDKTIKNDDKILFTQAKIIENLNLMKAYYFR